MIINMTSVPYSIVSSKTIYLARTPCFMIVISCETLCYGSMYWSIFITHFRHNSAYSTTSVDFIVAMALCVYKSQT